MAISSLFLASRAFGPYYKENNNEYF